MRSRWSCLATGDRLQRLLAKKKADTLTVEETLELAAIAELDEIFSYINAVMSHMVQGETIAASCTNP